VGASTAPPTPSFRECCHSQSPPPSPPPGALSAQAGDPGPEGPATAPVRGFVRLPGCPPPNPVWMHRHQVGDRKRGAATVQEEFLMKKDRPPPGSRIFP